MRNYDAMQRIFKVLADGNRLRIMDALTEECRSVNEIAEIAGISQPLASHHLKALREAGLTHVSNRATFNYY